MSNSQEVNLKIFGIFRIIVIFALVLSYIQIYSQVKYYDWPAGDEIWHYLYSKRILDSGETERESVHNYISTTPSVILNILSEKLVTKVFNRSDLSKIALRLPGFFWYSLLLIGTFLFSQRYFGKIAAWTSILLVSSDPNLQGHAALIGTDLPFAAITICLLLYAMRYYDDPKLLNIFNLGLFLGIAFLTKYLAVFLCLPILIILILTSYRCANYKSAIGNFIIHGILLISGSVLIINFGYGFIKFMHPMESINWYSPFFKGLYTYISDIPLPLPIDFISGLDHQLAVERGWAWLVIIFDKVHRNGVWYYFIVTWLFKTPLANILLFIVAGIIFLKNPKKLLSNRGFIACFLLATFFICYFSFIFHTQVGMRYCFMCLPLSYILLAACLTEIKFNRDAIIVVGVYCLTVILELAPYFSNNISFTNSLVWKKEKVYKLITDSNIDWFQNYDYANSVAKAELGKYYWNPSHILPGYNLFSINYLTGVFKGHAHYKWLRDNQNPLGHIGYSTILFEINQNAFNKFIELERSFESTTDDWKECGSHNGEHDLSKNGALELAKLGKQNTIEKICLRVEQEIDFELLNANSAAVVGKNIKNDCKGEDIYKNDILWFRLKPGVHSVCIKPRDSGFKLDWQVKKGSAKVYKPQAVVQK